MHIQFLPEILQPTLTKNEENGSTSGQIPAFMKPRPESWDSSFNLSLCSFENPALYDEGQTGERLPFEDLGNCIALDNKSRHVWDCDAEMFVRKRKKIELDLFPVAKRRLFFEDGERDDMVPTLLNPTQENLFKKSTDMANDWDIPSVNLNGGNVIPPMHIDFIPEFLQSPQENVIPPMHIDFIPEIPQSPQENVIAPIHIDFLPEIPESPQENVRDVSVIHQIDCGEVIVHDAQKAGLLNSRKFEDPGSCIALENQTKHTEIVRVNLFSSDPVSVDNVLPNVSSGAVKSVQGESLNMNPLICNKAAHPLKPQNKFKEGKKIVLPKLKSKVLVHQKENTVDSKSQVEQKTWPQFDSYHVEDEEGSGGYGTVYRATRKVDGKQFAIKCPHENSPRRHVNNEQKMLERFGGMHFIIKYIGSLSFGDSECFILEHAKHDRPEILKHEINMVELQWYGFCLFRALDYLHKQGVAHRDVKPGNFLFSRTRKTGYLIDFNLALDLQQMYTPESKTKSKNNPIRVRDPVPCQGRKELINLAHSVKQSESKNIHKKRISAPPSKPIMLYLTPMPLQSGGARVSGAGLLTNNAFGDGKHKKEGSCVGTKGFRAPEVLLRSTHQGFKMDVWSAGLCLLYLTMGKSPFTGDPEHNMKDIVKLRGSEDLWELAKLHNCESSFPQVLLDVASLPSMKLEEWWKLNTKRPDFLKQNPATLFDLLDKCLSVNPRVRLSADEALKHPFFESCQIYSNKVLKERRNSATK